MNSCLYQMIGSKTTSTHTKYNSNSNMQHEAVCSRFPNRIYLPHTVKRIHCIQHHITQHKAPSKTVAPSVRNIIYTHKYTVILLFICYHISIVIFLFWHKVVPQLYEKRIQNFGKSMHTVDSPPHFRKHLFPSIYNVLPI